ncbi:MAG: hypothetical protein COA78_24855 [Blastopirellula sp.]|nr:MAG: hypothetical protein COA78_24855 [Blastopirellula sp.]
MPNPRHCAAFGNRAYPIGTIVTIRGQPWRNPTITTAVAWDRPLAKAEIRVECLDGPVQLNDLEIVRINSLVAGSV